MSTIPVVYIIITIVIIALHYEALKLNPYTCWKKLVVHNEEDAI